MDSSGGGSVREYNKVARLEPLLATLLEDPILADVPKNATLAEIDTLISVELGSAMKLSILKMDNTVIDVAIPNNARVRDLKKVVERKVSGFAQVGMGHRHISWRHVWKNHCLCYLNQKLLEDMIPLQDYGIRNNCHARTVVAKAPPVCLIELGQVLEDAVLKSMQEIALDVQHHTTKENLSEKQGFGRLTVLESMHETASNIRHHTIKVDLSERTGTQRVKKSEIMEGGYD